MIFGKHINRYYIQYAPFLLLGIAALVLVDFFQLRVPELYRIVVNGVNDGVVEINGATVAFTMDVLLDEVCLPMIFIILAMVIGRFLWRVCFYGTAIRVETDLRCRMFEHSRNLSQEYYQQNKVGGLMSLYTNDLDTIQECVGDGVLMFWDALVLGLLAFVKMLRMDLLLTAFAMIPLLFLFAIGLTLSKVMVKRWEERQAAFSDLSDFSQESFSGIAVIKAFVKEYKELQAFCRLNRQNEDTNVSYTRISTLLNIMVTLFVESVVCVILGYGGYLVYCHQFDAGMLVEYIGYFTSIVWPFMAVAMLIEMHSRGRASLNRISELLDAEIDVKDRADVTDLDHVDGKIEFRHLTFRYPDGEFDALKDVCFTVEPGESVGIVGRTGAGKTTLVDLILRTRNVEDGTLFVDDRDVNTVSIRSLRDGCAYVPQDNFLFSDTIANNIAFSEDLPNDTDTFSGKDSSKKHLSENRPVSEKDSSKNHLSENGAVNGEDFPINTDHSSGDLRARIRSAAVAADVDDDISGFTEGYDTVLGERGVTVSGGQKQRISIARALMKDAPILILDDSVSAVDTGTERVILEHLKERKGKTTLLIAHRISTVQEMDKIIFLEDGRVLAVGTHDELYDRCGEYRKMVDLQKLEDEMQQGGHV